MNLEDSSHFDAHGGTSDQLKEILRNERSPSYPCNVFGCHTTHAT